MISIKQYFLYYQKRDEHFQDIVFGPGNPLDNGPPTNELDAICMEHDYCYSSNIPKSECDKNTLGKLSSSESKTFGEKLAKHLIVKPIIGTKYQLGLGKKK